MSVPEDSGTAADSGKLAGGTPAPPESQPEDAIVRPPTWRQNLFALALTVFSLAFVVLGGRGLYLHTHRGGAPAPGGVMTGRGSGGPGNATTGTGLPVIEINNMRVEFAGALRNGKSELQIEFKDANGQLVDVGSVKFALEMNMPGMQMHSAAVITGSGGHYRAKLQPEMAGDWKATLSYSGPRGSGQKSFTVAVQ
jgi:hypothetical protein